LSYVALNVGIFVTMSLLTKVRVDIAVGFGLFAILSIIRLRSSAVTQQEVAYYFLALVLGLVNGMGVPDLGLVVGMNLVLLLTMLAVDSRLLRDRSRRMDVRLDGVFTNEAALVAELERKLGGHVVYQEITEIDTIHGHMLIDVRLRPGEGVIEPPAEKPHHHHAEEARRAGDHPAGADADLLAARRDPRHRQGVPVGVAEAAVGLAGQPVRRGLDLHQDRRRLAVRPGARARAARGQGHRHQELIVARRGPGWPPTGTSPSCATRRSRKPRDPPELARHALVRDAGLCCPRATPCPTRR